MLENRYKSTNDKLIDEMTIQLLVLSCLSHYLILCLELSLFPIVLSYLVISKPNGPSPNSEYEHSSIPATIKKIFNLSSNFLTHRDAWAGTFEQVVGQLTSPRTDCPGNC